MRLQLTDVTIAYDGKLLLDHFTLSLRQGEMACLVGESGSGKTSILRAILGFVPLTAGEIDIDGTPLKASHTAALRQKVAYVPQELAFPTEWVSEMVRIPFDLRANHAIPFSQQRLLDCFEQLGLQADLLEKRMSEISGGQKQRIMIALAALLGKPLLLLDEPTSALDTESAARVIAFLQRLAAEGTTILVVSHDKQMADSCQIVKKL